MRTLIFIVLLILGWRTNAQQSDFNPLEFKMADTRAKQFQGEELYHLPHLVYQLTHDLPTDAAKFRAIYYWVTHNIKGDFYLMNRNDRMLRKYKDDPVGLAQWNASFKKEVFRTLREDKVTLCTGTALLIKAMCDLADLKSVVIHGYGPDKAPNISQNDYPSHSWNAVFIKGKWYLSDAAWATGYIDLSNHEFIFNYDDRFFFTAPEVFAKTHIPLNPQWTLLPIADSGQR